MNELEDVILQVTLLDLHPHNDNGVYSCPTCGLDYHEEGLLDDIGGYGHSIALCWRAHMKEAKHD